MNEIWSYPEEQVLVFLSILDSDFTLNIGYDEQFQSLFDRNRQPFPILVGFVTEIPGNSR